MKEFVSLFLLDYNKDHKEESNIYKCCDASYYGSTSYPRRPKHNEVANKYFRILDIVTVVSSTSSGNYYSDYLKLQEKESNDIVYIQDYFVGSRFIIVGYFEKQKKLSVGKQFVFADSFLYGKMDMQTNKPITQTREEAWKCVDLTLNEKADLMSIMENSLGEKIIIPYVQKSSEDNLYPIWEGYRQYTLSDAELYRKKYGKKMFDDFILQGRVKIGMTAAMCLLALGEAEYKGFDLWF